MESRREGGREREEQILGKRLRKIVRNRKEKKATIGKAKSKLRKM